jgi:hypothetical protein
MFHTRTGRVGFGVPNEIPLSSILIIPRMTPADVLVKIPSPFKFALKS